MYNRKKEDFYEKIFMYNTYGADDFSCISMLSASAKDTIEPELNRYYFYFPEEWECELSSDIYIYWWNGTNAHSNYPGVKAEKRMLRGFSTTMSPRMLKPSVGIMVWCGTK